MIRQIKRLKDALPELGFASVRVELRMKIWIFQCILKDLLKLEILMCPNCILNQSAGLSYLGPGLICLLFFISAAFFFLKGKETGDLKGDEEDPKYAVFDENNS